MVIKISLKRSLLGQKPNTRRNAKALGLSKIGQVVFLVDSPSLQGRLRRLQHLVEIEELQ